jgi:hypothetical protein
MNPGFNCCKAYNHSPRCVDMDNEVLCRLYTQRCIELRVVRHMNLEY